MMYIFIVDTDKYAGNFDRELVAYMTGQKSDYDNVGEEAARDFYLRHGVDGWMAVDGENYHARHPFDFVIEQPDENGIKRPSAVWVTPGWFNNGFADFRDGYEFVAKEHRRVKCLEMAEQRRGVHQQDHARNEQKWRAAAEEPMIKIPCCMSVAIFMDRAPTDQEIEFLKMRSVKYHSWLITGNTWSSAKDFKITGYRLIERMTIDRYVNNWEF